MAKTKMTPEEVATFWYNEAQKLQTAIEKLSDEISEKDATIADKDNQIRELTPKMTYEQIIDLKCENARLKEENAKFAKWKRILDKFKIF